jgi:choice-of-anchor A domain-containing protein
MKLAPPKGMFRGSIRVLLFGFVIGLFSISRASASLGDVLPELSDLQRWTLFTLGNDTGPDELSGNTVIQGDVGAAGVGDVTLKDTATIQGNLYYRSNGTLKAGPNTTITGAQIHDQDALLDNDADAAIATSRHAADLRRNFFAPPDIELGKNQDFTATGAPGETVVLKLGNFVLSGHSSFTLEGTASTTFVINVSSRFSLSGNAQIVLSGGVQWSNVLFNIRGKGPAVTLGDNSSFAGMLMANRRTIRLTDNAGITGELVANRIVYTRSSFNGGVTVDHPPIVSP